MNFKTNLAKYFELRKQIFEYFGYTEDWVTIPMDDQTSDYWLVTGEGSGDRYAHSPEPFTEMSISAGDKLYGGYIYTQRFLPKWVYRGEEYTMVCADTRCDGNKYLMIFDNKKECTDETLKKLYTDRWHV